MTLINFVAANQKYYAFNLLSVFIMVFWSVQYLLQHLLVQTQLSDQLLQPLILILQLPQTPRFRHARPGKFFLLVVKCGLRNSHLSADFPDAGAGFSLFQGKCNLFFGITGLFHGNAPLCEMEERPETSV